MVDCRARTLESGDRRVVIAMVRGYVVIDKMQPNTARAFHA